MNTAQAINKLRQRILGGCPFILLETYEEERWEEEIAELALEIERGLVTWTSATGPQPEILANATGGTVPLVFLKSLPEYPPGHLFLLKDLHPYLTQPDVVRQLRDLGTPMRARQQTILLMSPAATIPLELLKDVSVMEMPLPGLEEMRAELDKTLQDQDSGIRVQPDPKQCEHLIKAVLGLTAAEARRAYRQALSDRDEVNDDVYATLVAEKRHMVQGSDLLEFFDLEEGLDDIGGLDGLKDWLKQRAEGFSEDARARGIGYPKGVLLTGVQGCGKSLSAKAIARLLGFPLVRMEIANLLDAKRGSSEQNLRDVLHLMESIAPSVLWLEEIDKAFAGFSEEASQDATMSRIVGRFLTWLQEHQAPVFVVATANNVNRLPPELLRRGRFDELFFVDLPNFYERKSIFEIHLKRRGWRTDKFDVAALANATEGYSGAEIEQIVNSAVMESYGEQRMLSQADLLGASEQTVPLSVTMEDEIFRIREWARTRCRPATPDNRVMQVMDEEERRGEIPQARALAAPKWLELAEFGQIPAAIIEHIRLHDYVTWEQVVTDFAEYLEVKGEFGLVLQANPKVVLWTRISQELADIMADLIERKRIYLHVAEIERYAPAQRLTLPAISKLPSERVSQPFWFPCTFRLLPPTTGSTNFNRVARIRLGKKN